jgi:hypothetical protein
VTRLLLNLFGNGFYAATKRARGNGETGDRPTLQVSTRDRALCALGYRVIRIWNNDVIENLDGVLQTLLSELEKQPLTPALSPQAEAGRGR